jgi:aminoglycoside 2''-phosphotransferase
MDVSEATAAAKRWSPRAGTPRPLGEGDFCAAWLVDERFVIRLAKHELATQALRREAQLLPTLVHRLPLPVPRPLLLGETPNGSTFVVHELVRGTPLTREAWAALSPSVKTKVGDQLAAFLAALHATPTGLGMAAGVLVHDPLTDYGQHLAGIEAHIFERMGDRVRAACIGLLATSARTSPDDVLVHGDLSPEHVLFDEARGALCGVIDFGDIAFAEDDYDLRLLDEDYGPDLVAAVLRAAPADVARARALRARMFSVWDTLLWMLARIELGHEVPADVFEELKEQALRDDP